VLRLVLRLEGETILDGTPVIGYLHRGMEKIFENRTFMQGIRYTDNSDYLSPMLCEIAYVGAAEQILGLEPPRRAQYIRLLVGEMQRIAWQWEPTCLTWEHSPSFCGPSVIGKGSYRSLRP
jgi:NADH-quinone oxidoreductase subunit D